VVDGKKAVKTLATANEAKNADNIMNDRLGLEAFSSFSSFCMRWHPCGDFTRYDLLCLS